jgi:hypothetical protein
MNIRIIYLLSVVIFMLSCENKNDYPPDIIQNFMNSCQKQSGGKQQTCACIIEQVQYKFTLEEFLRIDASMKEGGKIPEEMKRIVVDCKSKVLKP